MLGYGVGYVPDRSPDKYQLVRETDRERPAIECMCHCIITGSILVGSVSCVPMGARHPSMFTAVHSKFQLLLGPVVCPEGILPVNQKESKCRRIETMSHCSIWWVSSSLISYIPWYKHQDITSVASFPFSLTEQMPSPLISNSTAPSKPGPLGAA